VHQYNERSNTQSVRSFRLSSRWKRIAAFIKQTGISHVALSKLPCLPPHRRFRLQLLIFRLRDRYVVGFPYMVTAAANNQTTRHKSCCHDFMKHLSLRHIKTLPYASAEGDFLASQSPQCAQWSAHTQC
jgi:hypothetical protein